MFKCRNKEFLNPAKPFSIPRRNKYFWFNFYHFSNTSDYGKVNCSWLQINPIFNGFRSSPSTVFRKIYFYPGCWGMVGGRRYFWNFYGFSHSAEGFMDFSHPMCMPAKPFLLLQRAEESFQSIIVLRGKENVQHAWFN